MLPLPRTRELAKFSAAAAVPFSKDAGAAAAMPSNKDAGYCHRRYVLRRRQQRAARGLTQPPGAGQGCAAHVCMQCQGSARP